METSPRVYETTAIDAASYLAALGFAVTILRGTGPFALFEFDDTPELRDAICDYERGGFNKRLLNTRSRLYREASEVMKGSRGGSHD